MSRSGSGKASGDPRRMSGKACYLFHIIAPLISALLIFPFSMMVKYSSLDLFSSWQACWRCSCNTGGYCLSMAPKIRSGLD